MKTKPKHTPGPWTIHDNPFSGRCIYGPLFSDGPAQYPLCAEVEHTTLANAFLIAAAPDLLEAAKGVLASRKIMSFQKGGVSYGGDKITITQEAEDLLRAAIARAEGGEIS